MRVVEVGLASNGPHIGTLMESDFRFPLGAKPRDRELPLSWFEAGETRETWERRDRKTGAVRRFDRDCGPPPGDAHFDLKVTMPECVETSKRGRTTPSARVAGPPLDRTAVRAVMRRARRRRAIENETFKTLKSGDMHSFERNHGHGGNHLRDVFGALAMPAFPIDRIRQHCRGPFKGALHHRGRNPHLRDDPRDLVRGVAFPDRETLYRALAGKVGFALVRDGPWPQNRAPAHCHPFQPSPLPKPFATAPGGRPDGPPCAPETLEPAQNAKAGGKNG